MSSLCREFGISRKTGYKILDHYKESGLEAFDDRSRRPYRQANQLPFQVETTIIQIKKEKPHWGAPKIREQLIRRYPNKIWLVSFMKYDMGYFDEDSCRVEPLHDPFGSKVLPMSSV